MTDNITTPNQYWSQPLDDVLVALRSTPNGLRIDDARQRLEECGANALEAREKVTALRLFLDQFRSPLVLILVYA